MDLDEVKSWPNEKIYKELKNRNERVGPITSTTKSLYAKRLFKLLQQEEKQSETMGSGEPQNPQVSKVKRSKRASSIGASRQKTKRESRIVQEIDNAIEQVMEISEPVVAAPEPVLQAPEPIVEVAQPASEIPCEPLKPAVDPVKEADKENVLSSSTNLTTNTQQFSYEPAVWKSTDPYKSRAEMLRSAVTKRRSLHQGVSTYQTSSVSSQSKLAFQSEKHEATTKSSSSSGFWSWKKFYFIVFLVLFFWLVYFVMESNPSSLSLL